MVESRDPAIKLFGKTIPLPSDGEAPAVSGEDGGREEDKVCPDEERTTESSDEVHGSPNLEEKSEPAKSSTASETEKASFSCQQTASDKESDPEDQQNETNNSLEKTLKKPDKILPCPRCNSMDTKFCYYNNYNVNQPRHFCKNCQRYWTAGGTMRNVPVGSGRRKNKNAASQYRHITVSDSAFQTVNPEVPDAIHHPPLKPNGTVLSFGSDAPLCESMASVLSLAEKTMKNCNRNQLHRLEEQMVPLPAVENDGDKSSASSVTASNSTTEDGTAGNRLEPVQSFHGYQAQIPYINGSPWPYPWSPVPAFCPSSIPMSFYPATGYWGCTVPGPWSVPWLSPLATSSNNGSSGSGPNSLTLGKHSREGDVLNHTKLDKGNINPNNQERNLWIPKTLRIDDLEEAAKSSIWTAIGLKNDMADGISSCGLFKALHSKADIKNHTMNSQAFHTNPAALSRSLNFQESS